MSRSKTHPGEILNEEFLKPFNLSARSLATSIGTPQSRISDIIRARRGMTADTALRLGLFFGTSPEFWLNAQTAYDLSKAKSERDYSAGI